ncbi:MAG: type II secretion system protein M [Burkholderiaceae bacterium]|nr:type II secretion system protein M [Burkholderiaceae bacterium]
MSDAGQAALPAPLSARWGALRDRWRGLSARDRRLAWLAGTVLAAFLLWSVAIQPAWRTLRDAPLQRERLDLQLQEMRALAAEAQQLRQAPALGIEQSAAALRAASERLGSTARLSIQGERAVLTLNGVSSLQLREWLVEARAGARARPVEAQLSRGAQGFNGSVVLSLGGGS